MGKINKGLEVPYQSEVVQKSGMLSLAWQNFFRTLFLAISPLGIETSFELANNQTSAANIDGLQFDWRKTTCVFVDFIIQRVTQSTGRIEKLEAGTFKLVYRPYDQSWELDFPTDNWPDDSGVTLSVTTDGQVQYTTTNETGLPQYSKITYRARTLSAKVSV